MPAGNDARRTKGRPLDVMSKITKSIVTVKALLNCMGYAVIIAMPRVNGDTKYKSYSNGRGSKNLLKISCNLPVLMYPTVEVFRKFRSLKTIFRNTKLFNLTFRTTLGFCLGVIHVRPENYIYYITGTMAL